MKRELLLPLCAAAIACAAAVLLRMLPIQEPSPPAALQTDAASGEDAAPSSAAQRMTQPLPRWRMGVWQGHVAVFDWRSDLPRRVLETELISLPAPDRSALEEGIPVYTVEELAGLIEDYDT